jgi:hypothetical protein
VVVVTKVEEFLPCELGSVVGDDRVGYAKAINDVGEERDRLLWSEESFPSTSHSRMGNRYLGSSRFTSGGSSIAMTSSSDSSGAFSLSSHTND